MGIEGVCWGLQFDAGLRLIMTSDSEIKVVRSTVALMFISNIDEMIYRSWAHVLRLPLLASGSVACMYTYAHTHTQVVCACVTVAFAGQRLRGIYAHTHTQVVFEPLAATHD